MKETKCSECKKVIPKETIFRVSEDGKITLCRNCFEKLGYGED